MTKQPTKGSIDQLNDAAQPSPRTEAEPPGRQRQKGAPPNKPRSRAELYRGTLSNEVIRRVVSRRINEVKFCFERMLAKRPDVHVRGFQFVINTDGSVSDATLMINSGPGDDTANACIVNAISRWVFPPPQGGRVKVTYPFPFHSPDG